MKIKDMSIDDYKKVVDCGFNIYRLEDLMHMCNKMTNPNDWWVEMKEMLKDKILDTDIHLEHTLFINGEKVDTRKELVGTIEIESKDDEVNAKS